MTTNELSFSLGARLRLVREKADMSPEAMADDMAISVSSVKNWELGYATPTPRKVRRWASIVARKGGYTLDEVLAFLDIISVEEAAERRRVERRAPSRLPGDGSTCDPSIRNRPVQPTRVVCGIGPGKPDYAGMAA